MKNAALEQQAEFPPELAMNYGDDTGMDDETFKGIVDSEISAAVSFIDSDIGPLRAEAMRYYRGDPLGNEEAGRSQIVSRDVADTVNAILPSLVRMMCGGENVVEFVPESEEDEEVAEQQTDYVNYIVMRDNPGFEIVLAVCKNALREKVGIVKYWWDDSVEVTTRRYTGLDMDGLTKLLEDISASLEYEITDKEEIEGPPDEMGQPTQQLNVTLKLKRKRDRVAIAAVPPEEFLICRDAVSLDTARFVAHRRDLTVSELVAMGYDRKMVENEMGEEDDLTSSDERLARTPWTRSRFAEGPSADKSTRTVRYVEGYILADYDDDGIAELRKFCRIGNEVVHNEMVDERPFADFHCDPEPHTFFGESMADKVIDLQKLKTALTRSGLDSLSSTIFPRIVVGTGGDVNMDDVLNNEVGAVIRARDVSQVEALVTSPVSEQALSWVSYADEVRENRTGLSKVSQGLDAEALQNTTATAAEGQFTRSQERIELIARVMASGMRRLFRGISGLVASNQQKARTVKLRNKWVDIDPRKWRTDMDVTPNVALGGGSDQQKMAMLTMILAKQESALELGMPHVTLKNYFDTLSKTVETGGFKNPSLFFRDPESEEAKREAVAKAQQGPPPDPKMVEVQGKLQLEGQKAQAGVQMDAQRLQHEREKAAEQAQTQRMQIAEEIRLKRETAAAELDLKERISAAELAMKERILVAELALKQRQADHSARLAEQSADIGDVQVGGEPG